MKKLLTAALCAASMMLASCATMPTPSTDRAAQIGSAIDRAQAAYDRIAGTAEVILPFLSKERAARIRLATSLAERGLLAAVCGDDRGTDGRVGAGRGSDCNDRSYGRRLAAFGSSAGPRSRQCGTKRDVLRHAHLPTYPGELGVRPR